ncbi:GNAT family N-acetyltransferase [Actinomycetospora straminea]|uniref:N-acetyltransferase domain-containing protein n=1 Tax=Actinomycetospora straminea TaxID=663607 RepID=A0ABP9EMU2_9PSEU|nr:GNAT family N-acetyltransferase [Actinomycetospora straminea]MDD7935056.1 GNAT family N-acetyltransferase [Actinomycetospora straminea]
MGVTVVPLQPEQAVTLLTEPEAFTERFGLVLVDGYLAFPEALEPTVTALEGGVDPSWFTHLVVDGTEVVGLGGFTGPPTDGEIEIGYSVAPSRQGRGIATAAVGQWLERAERGGVRRVRAHTLPQENASTTVLRRHGFVLDGEATDPDEGTVWRWVRDLRPVTGG